MVQENDKKKLSSNALSAMVYELFVHHNKTREEVKTTLMQNELSENEANGLINIVLGVINDKNIQAKKNIKEGKFFLIIGLIITIFTFLLSEYLSIYVITWGFIFYGIYKIYSGLSSRVKFDEKDRK